MRTLLLASLLICAAVTGCVKRRVVAGAPPPSSSANTLIEGTVIRGPGSWTYTNGRITRSLSITLAGKDLEWFYQHNHSGTSGGGGSSMPATTPSPWFFYVESPQRIWIFDGTGDLSCQIQDADGSSETLNAIGGGEIRDDCGQVPREVVPLLPADLQKLFPAIHVKPRPSI